MTIAVIDYGAGNLGSVLRALRRIGVDALLAEAPLDLRGSSHVLLPGVGSFATAMGILEKGGWSEAIAEHVAAERPLLGICLGMQLLGSSGTEGGDSSGLGLVPGRVVHLRDLGSRLRLPHVGWNGVQIHRISRLFAGVPDGTDFYFANSFALVPDDDAHVIGRSDHGCTMSVAVQVGATFGIQFHPEKSSEAGLRILKNFAAC